MCTACHQCGFFLDAVYLFAILPGSHLGFHSYSSLNCRRCTDTETHAYRCLRCHEQYKQRSGQEVLFEGFEVPQSFLYFAILKSGKELISLLFIYFILLNFLFFLFCNTPDYVLKAYAY